MSARRDTAAPSSLQLDLEETKPVVVEHLAADRIAALRPGLKLFGGQWTEQAMAHIAALYAQYGETVEIGSVQAVAGWHAVRFADGDSHRQSQRRCADVLGVDVKTVRRADLFLHLVGLLTISTRQRCRRTVEIGPLWPQRPRSQQGKLGGNWSHRGTRRGAERDQTESPTDSEHGGGSPRQAEPPPCGDHGAHFAGFCDCRTAKQ